MAIVPAEATTMIDHRASMLASLRDPWERRSPPYEASAIPTTKKSQLADSEPCETAYVRGIKLMGLYSVPRRAPARKGDGVMV